MKDPRPVEKWWPLLVLDRNLDTAKVPGVSPLLWLAVSRMSEIGVPAAVFIVPAR
jgi:hypothetical protein